jgi:hypothetical protein
MRCSTIGTAIKAAPPSKAGVTKPIDSETGYLALQRTHGKGGQQMQNAKCSMQNAK